MNCNIFFELILEQVQVKKVLEYVNAGLLVQFYILVNSQSLNNTAVEPLLNHQLISSYLGLNVLFFSYPLLTETWMTQVVGP